MNAGGLKLWALAPITASLLIATNTAKASSNQDWAIKKSAWSDSDERNFGAFISALGDANCHTVDSCLKSTANPYRGTDSTATVFESDCGRFPFLLRAYFAWKNSLPFSVVSSVAAVDGLGHDLRYSPKGNYVVTRKDIISKSAKPLSGLDGIDLVMNAVSTAIYRYNAENDKPAGLFFDFAPAGINRNDVRPGTVIYDANGHAAMVYRVETDGRVKYIDAHPDHSVTRSEYGKKFVRSSPNSGGGFKNFRPLLLSGATRAADGSYIGGHVTTIPMTQMPSFSMEQFYGNQPSPDHNWKKAGFVKSGQRLDFYDWVRSSLAVGDLKYHPIEEMTNSMTSLCGDIQDRVGAVDEALARGIAVKPQPYALPDNIYGTSGEWESYSTPSRDARLKTSFKEVREDVQRFVELYRQASPRIDYHGTNLVLDLRNAYDKTANACVIQYKRTDGSMMSLNYGQLVSRLFDLSFDPYQCVELRWGATTAQELSTCHDDSTKRAWYDAEKNLRNQIDRPYDQKMGFTLDQLRAHVPGSGTAAAPDVDLRGYLNSL